MNQLWGQTPENDESDTLVCIGLLVDDRITDALIDAQHLQQYTYLEIRKPTPDGFWQRTDCWGSSPSYTAERIFCNGNGAI